MIKLTSINISKYKSIVDSQDMKVEEGVTTLVGMNESGKTAILETIAKANYFEEDEDYKFKLTRDFPRKELKRFQRTNDEGDQVGIRCDYLIQEELMDQITSDVGENVLKAETFSVLTHYDNQKKILGVNVNNEVYLNALIKEFNLSGEEAKEIRDLSDINDVSSLLFEHSSEDLKACVSHLQKKIIGYSDAKWDNPIERYIYFKWIQPNIPKFWYYDEYFSLESRINLLKLKNGKLEQSYRKTAQALLEVAQLDLDTLTETNDFEEFTSELEATSNEITATMFDYWSANEDLDIRFAIDNKNKEYILDIRVYNRKHQVTIPLSQRSKGFNWFFSFIIWFSKIQYDEDSNYILLLDEPGLNLHASAQKDLLRFIEDLSKDYQIIFTTHSPFMVDSTRLDRVRTVYEGEKGTTISDSSEERDKNTLFPLQAALGYELSQNLFVGKNNLLVEGPADLLYLKSMSEHLFNIGREGLDEDIVIVPVGGLDKIPAFISLMTGNELNLVALLGSFGSSGGQQRLQEMIQKKIIKEKNIRFFDEFIEGMDKSDIEDLFTQGEYLKYFKKAFPHYEIKVKDLEDKNRRIIPQLNRVTDQKRFNHYKPAQEFAVTKHTEKSFTEGTLQRFEKIFSTINNRFQTQR